MKEFLIFFLLFFILENLLAKSIHNIAPQSTINEFFFKTDSLINDLIEKGKTVQITSYNEVFTYYIKPEYIKSYKNDLNWWKKENFKIVGFIDNYMSFGFIDVYRDKEFDYIFVAFDDPFNIAPFSITILDDWNKIYKGLGRSLMIIALQISKFSGAKEFKVKCIKNDFKTLKFFKDLGFIEESKGNMFFNFSKTEIPTIIIRKVNNKPDNINFSA